MKSFTQPWTVYRINKMYEKGTLSLEYYLQRPSEQWDRQKKSLWIHTLITNLPKYPIFTRKVDGIYYVLEGKQRIDSFISYINNKFSLSRKTPDVYDEDLKETYHIAGMKFNKLPEPLKNALSNNVINQYTLDGNDEEIESFFDRINNGASLTPQQQAKAKMGKTWALTLNRVSRNPFFLEDCNFSKAQLRHSESELAVLSYMMLNDPDYSLLGLSNGLIARYAASLRNAEANKNKLIDQLEKTLDYLHRVIVEPEKELAKRMNLPMLFIVADEALKKDVDPKLFRNWMKIFKESLAGKSKGFPTNYRNFCGQGSVKREKVLGRAKEITRHFDNYLKKATAVPSKNK